ncbi:hypothetical protein, partial [Alteromonas stellipolaris]|uniref:hypothetical protein n=1 Tax=Alteromonas stellipolaris TaxID=233316 RepID=UPI001D7E82E2
QTVAQNQIHSEVGQQFKQDFQSQLFFNEQSSLFLGVEYDYIEPDPPLPPGTLEACLEILKEAQNKLASQTKATQQSMFETNQQILESCARMQ